MCAQRAVVTGGLGFVGSHLVDSLLADDNKITVLDNGVSGRERNLSDSRGEQLEVLEHNVRKPFPEFEDVDVIYHFASRASPKSFDDHPVSIALTNSIGTKNALECAKRTDAKIVLASTSGVYGEPEVSPQPETYTGNVELHNKRAPYDESKRFAEALAEAYLRKYDLDVRIVRPFNVYGPRLRPKDGRVISNFLTQALTGDPLTVYGDGEQIRCFCYVSDLVEGIRKLAALPTESGRGVVVNLGNDTEMSIIELAELVLSIVDTDSGITYSSRPKGDPSSRKPDIQYAKDLLGWEPSTDLESGIRNMMAWYRQHVLKQPLSGE